MTDVEQIFDDEAQVGQHGPELTEQDYLQALTRLNAHPIPETYTIPVNPVIWEKWVEYCAALGLDPIDALAERGISIVQTEQ